MEWTADDAGVGFDGFASRRKAARGATAARGAAPPSYHFGIPLRKRFHTCTSS
jgi:hypothetical protein